MVNEMTNATQEEMESFFGFRMGATTEQKIDLAEKKIKKKIDSLQQRIQRLRQQLAGAKKQKDESGEAAVVERQLDAAAAELAKLKTS